MSTAARIALGVGAGLLLTLGLSLAGAPTRGGIADGLAFCLKHSDHRMPGRACECVEQFERVCLGAGFERRCFADGWNDRDYGEGAWVLAVCEDRRRRGLEP